MIEEVRLPEISENVDTGDVIKLLVAVGDVVNVDQPLLELETDKAVFEVPSTHQGKVTGILVKPGETIKVGQVLVTIDTADTAVKNAAPVTAPAATPKPPAQILSEGAATTSVSPPPTRKPGEETAAVMEPPPLPRTPSHAAEELPLASPAVRRLARELGVDLHKVRGSGEGGRIQQEDLKAFARHVVAETAAPAAAASPISGAGESTRWGQVVREPMSKVREVTARTMAYAWATVPHVTQYDKADITALETARKKYAERVEKSGGKLTFTAILLKVSAAALKIFPKFNASIDIEKREIVYKKYYHIGVAVDTDRGLLVPVIRDVERKNITELSIELAAIAEKARARKISPDELEGGTFTVSNLGGIGGTSFSPIVYPPQVAILGSARARIEPVYVGGEFAPRLLLPLSVSYDHRIIDGADGARFLRWIVEALEDPLLISLEG